MTDPDRPPGPEGDPIAETIARVRALDAAATKGPWTTSRQWPWPESAPEPLPDCGIEVWPAENVLGCASVLVCERERDVPLVAYYRTAAPILADECERLAALFQQTHGVHHGWIAECQRLRERVRVLEEALAWYSDIRGYTSPGADDGRIARAALEGK